METVFTSLPVNQAVTNEQPVNMPVKQAFKEGNAMPLEIYIYIYKYIHLKRFGVSLLEHFVAKVTSVASTFFSDKDLF